MSHRISNKQKSLPHYAHTLQDEKLPMDEWSQFETALKAENRSSRQRGLAQQRVQKEYLESQSKNAAIIAANTNGNSNTVTASPLSPSSRTKKDFGEYKTNNASPSVRRSESRRAISNQTTPSASPTSLPTLPQAEQRRLMETLLLSDIPIVSSDSAYSSRVSAANHHLNKLNQEQGLPAMAGAETLPRKRSPVRRGYPSLTNPNKNISNTGLTGTYGPPAPNSSLSKYLPANHPLRLNRLGSVGKLPSNSGLLPLPANMQPSAAELKAIQEVYTRLTSPLFHMWSTPSYCKKLTSRDIDAFIEELGSGTIALFQLHRLEKAEKTGQVRRFKSIKELQKFLSEKTNADLGVLVLAQAVREQCTTILSYLTRPQCSLLSSYDQSYLSIGDCELLLHLTLETYQLPTQTVLESLEKERLKFDSIAALTAAVNERAQQLDVVLRESQARQEAETAEATRAALLEQQAAEEEMEMRTAAILEAERQAKIEEAEREKQEALAVAEAERNSIAAERAALEAERARLQQLVDDVERAHLLGETFRLFNELQMRQDQNARRVGEANFRLQQVHQDVEASRRSEESARAVRAQERQTKLKSIPLNLEAAFNVPLGQAAACSPMHTSERSHRSTVSQQEYAAKALAAREARAEEEARVQSEMNKSQAEREKQQSEQYLREQQELLDRIAADRAREAREIAEAKAAIEAKEAAERAVREKEEAEIRYLNDYANFAPSPLYNIPFNEEENIALLTFLQHVDNTLLPDQVKRTLTISQLSQLVDPHSHYSLELILVHLQHLNITGTEYASLAALREAIEFAENESELHGGAPLVPLPENGVKGPASHGGSYQIRRKIFLYLKRADVKIYPQITWNEVEQLFILTLAGPRLGSILYRLDQIGVQFPTFHALLTHVSEIYARKASQHSKNVQTLFEFLLQHQEVIYYEPMNEEEEVRPKIKSLPLFVEPLVPTLGMVKQLMELGLGISTMIYLLECFLQSRFQFDSQESLTIELKRSFAFYQAIIQKVHTFLTSSPNNQVSASQSNGTATEGVCVLAMGPSNPLPPARETAAARARREKRAALNAGKKRITFLTHCTVADAERLVRESGVMNYTSSSVAGHSGGEGADTGDDQILNILVQLNTQVDLQIKPPYTTFDQIISDVRALRTNRFGLERNGSALGTDGIPYSATSAHMAGVEEAEDVAEALAEEEEVRAREQRRKARARRRGKLVAGIISQLREYLLSAEATVLRRKKEGLIITDAELQALLACGGGSFDSVKGHCRQLVDQKIFVASIAELQESISYSHQLALEQQKEHRRILFESLRNAGLLDPHAFPREFDDDATLLPDGSSQPKQLEYVSDDNKVLDDALSQLLYFNSQNQHPLPKAQVFQTNYFYNPLSTLQVLKFLVELIVEQRNLQQQTNAGLLSSTVSAEPVGLASPTAADKKKDKKKKKKRSDDNEDGEEQQESVSTGAAPSESPDELKAKNLGLILNQIHALYTSYLHAKKQVFDYFHSNKCELSIMGPAPSPTAAEDSSSHPVSKRASGAASPVPASSKEHVNVLAICTISDVESLFEGAHIGLKVLPYLMELAFSPKKDKVFSSWTELKLALAKLHAKKAKLRTERDKARTELRRYMTSIENAILRADLINRSAANFKGSKKDALSSFEWTDSDLDQLLEAGAHSLSTTILHLRNLNLDPHAKKHITSLPILVESIRQAQRTLTKHFEAIRAFLHSKIGHGLLLSQGSYAPEVPPSNDDPVEAFEVKRYIMPTTNHSKVSLAEIERLYLESTAQGKTIAYIQQFAAAGKAFADLDKLISAVRAAHNEMVKQENKEKMVLASFFASSTSHLFTQTQQFSDEEIAAIHTEKMNAPFSLLLLSLSALTAADQTFDNVLEFRDKLHQNHVALINDYSKSLDYLTGPTVLHRIFDADKVQSVQATNENPHPPFTQKIVLNIFERLEAQVVVFDCLMNWEKEGYKFESYTEFLKELLKKKMDADHAQAAFEQMLELRHQVKILLAYYHILPEEIIKLIDPIDIDGMLSLGFAVNGEDPIALLHTYFANYKAQGLKFHTFPQVVRMIQVEIPHKPAHFTYDHTADEKLLPGDKATQDDDEKDSNHKSNLGQGGNQRKYVLSAPLHVDHEAEAHATIEGSALLLPSQRKSSKYILFMPDAGGKSDSAVFGANGASSSGAPTAAKVRLQLVSSLLALAEKQPWLEGTDENGNEAVAEEQAARRYQLFCALSWPSCHLFSSRTIPLALNDDDLDELLLACGQGAPAVNRAIDLVRTLDGEGLKFYDMESLVLEVADRFQRRELQSYLSTYGGILAELVKTPQVMASAFVEKLIAHTGAASGELDPMLPLSHLLARTQAFFEAQIQTEKEHVLKRALAEGDPLEFQPKEITLEHFLATFKHFAQTQRRGILHSLLLQGLPPFYESLFVDNLTTDQIQSQLSERRLDALLATHGGSLYRAVRTLKELEVEEHRFNSAQELIDTYVIAANTRKNQRHKEIEASGIKQEALKAEKARRAQEVESSNVPQIEGVSSDDPSHFQRRQAIFTGLSAPACLLFSERRDHIALTDKDLDEIVELGGGLPSTLHFISTMDEEGLKFFSFERAVIAMSERKQWDQVKDFWIEVQQNAKQCFKDHAKQQACAESGTPYRFFTQDKSDMKEPMTTDLFKTMMAQMGGVDPNCTLLSVLQALSRRDGSTVVPTPLFTTRDELLAAIQQEAQLKKRHALSLYLFHPARTLLSLPIPPSANAKNKLCKFEGLSGEECDELLSMCDNSLFLTLRHCHMLERSGFFFHTSFELLEALVLTQQHLLEEEEDQKDPLSEEERKLQRQENEEEEAKIAAKLAAEIEAEAIREAEHEERVAAGEQHIHALQMSLAASTKLHYQSQIGVHGSDYLPPFNPDDDVLNDREISHSTRRVEDEWRSGVDTNNVQQSFVDAMQASDIFSECNPFPSFSSVELEQCVSWCKGDLALFQGSLLELERQHQRYYDSYTFMGDLKLLTVHHMSEELLSALSFPRCTIFGECEDPVEVDEMHLRLLIKAAGHSLVNAKKYLLAIDGQGIKLKTIEELVNTMKRLHEMKHEVKSDRLHSKKARETAAKYGVALEDKKKKKKKKSKKTGEDGNTPVSPELASSISPVSPVSPADDAPDLDRKKSKKKKKKTKDGNGSSSSPVAGADTPAGSPSVGALAIDPAATPLHLPASAATAAPAATAEQQNPSTPTPPSQQGAQQQPAAVASPSPAGAPVTPAVDGGASSQPAAAGGPPVPATPKSILKKTNYQPPPLDSLALAEGDSPSNGAEPAPSEKKKKKKKKREKDSAIDGAISSDGGLTSDDDGAPQLEKKKSKKKKRDSKNPDSTPVLPPAVPEEENEDAAPAATSQ